MAKDRIYIDACPIIDYVKGDRAKDITEKIKSNNWLIRQMLTAASQKEIELVTSTLTIAECRRAYTDKPATEEQKRLIRSVLTSEKIFVLIQVTPGVAKRARDLEWEEGINLKGADAIHVASALITDCAELFTTDARGMFKNALKIEKLGLRIIQASDTALLPPKYLQPKLIRS
jgi:predicted nucleic acid-binding protein